MTNNIIPIVKTFQYHQRVEILIQNNKIIIMPETHQVMYFQNVFTNHPLKKKAYLIKFNDLMAKISQDIVNHSERALVKLPSLSEFKFINISEITKEGIKVQYQLKSDPSMNEFLYSFKDMQEHNKMKFKKKYLTNFIEITLPKKKLSLIFNTLHNRVDNVFFVIYANDPNKLHLFVHDIASNKFIDLTTTIFSANFEIKSDIMTVYGFNILNDLIKGHPDDPLKMKIYLTEPEEGGLENKNSLYIGLGVSKWYNGSFMFASMYVDENKLPKKPEIQISLSRFWDIYNYTLPRVFALYSFTENPVIIEKYLKHIWKNWRTFTYVIDDLYVDLIKIYLYHKLSAIETKSGDLIKDNYILKIRRHKPTMDYIKDHLHLFKNTAITPLKHNNDIIELNNIINQITSYLPKKYEVVKYSDTINSNPSKSNTIATISSIGFTIYIIPLELYEEVGVNDNNGKR